MLALKPANLSCEQATSVPLAVVTALQRLDDHGTILAGQKALLNGASGGVGTFAVQIAKSFGTEVTAVVSTRSLQMVKSICADHAIDFTQDDFTRMGVEYDLMFDTVGNRKAAEFQRALASEGTFVTCALLPELLLHRSKSAGQSMVSYVANANADDLEVLRVLIKACHVTLVVDRRFGVEEVPRVLRCLEQGHSQGKVVIMIENNDSSTTNGSGTNGR